MFYAIYMATRPRACACIFHKTLGLMLYLLHTIYLDTTFDRITDIVTCVYTGTMEKIGECFNLAILPKIAKLKTAKLKFSGGRNISAVVATPETPNKKTSSQLKWLIRQILYQKVHERLLICYCSHHD